MRRHPGPFTAGGRVDPDAADEPVRPVRVEQRDDHGRRAWPGGAGRTDRLGYLVVGRRTGDLRGDELVLSLHRLVGGPPCAGRRLAGSRAPTGRALGAAGPLEAAADVLA